MADVRSPRVVILDYGVGNLFSVKHACHAVGLDATITADKTLALAADAVIVPGVGAFGDAMATLNRLDLIAPLRDIAQSGKPLIGICLGLQLFMSESEEFGHHQGLGFFNGPVVRFNQPRGPKGPLKVPQVGWNRIFPPGTPAKNQSAPEWTAGPLAGLPAGEFMYFVHSYYVKPQDSGVVLTISRYGDTEFCSSLRSGSIFACQFHPERSGKKGLQIYGNIARHIAENLNIPEKTHA